MRRRFDQLLGASRYSTLDERLINIILKVTPLLTITVIALYSTIQVRPNSVTLILAVYGVFMTGLLVYKSEISTSLLKIIVVLSLYALNLTIWYFTMGDPNCYYLFLVNLFLTLVIYRKHIILLSIINFTLVICLSLFYDSQFAVYSIKINEIFVSLRFNYFVMAIVTLLLAYILNESILIEQNKSRIYRKRLEEYNKELEKKNKELEQFNFTQNRLLGVISHDVKNPIDNFKL